MSRSTSHSEQNDTATHPADFAIAIVGLAFYWPFLRHFELVALCSGYPDPSATAWSSYTHIVLPLALFLLAGTIARKQTNRLIASRPLAICIASIHGTAGYALLFAAPLTGFTEAIYLTGCLLVAFSYATLTFSWMRSVSLAPSGNPFVCLVTSYALSCVLSLLANISGPATLPLMAAGPLVSGVLWFAHQRVCPCPATDHMVGPCLDKLPLTLIGVFVLFLIAGRTAAGILIFDSSEIPFIERSLASGISCIVLIALVATMRKSARWDQLLQFNWSLLALLFLICLVLLATDKPLALHLGIGGIEACLGCFEITLWVLLTKAVRSEKVDPIVVFGLSTLVVRLLPNYVGKYLVPSLAVSAGGFVRDHIVALIALMSLLLAAVTVLFLNARLTKQLMPQEARTGESENVAEKAETREQDSGRAAKIASHVGLTPRETDVMLLMARGFSYQKIAEELGVSVGTVQNHVKHVYRKTNVHARQELIDLVS